MDLKTFSKFLKSKLINYSNENSSQRMRGLIKSKLFLFTDLHSNPEKFFLAHRIVASITPEIGTGFWVRLTVQYNLFAGTILALGTQHHMKELNNIQEQGLLGCFCLTETFAGVHSGLVINITAEWNNATKQFVINSPTMESAKNWISQGLVADKAVIIATLVANNKQYGIQGFLVNLRENGVLLPGISMWDMGKKTVGNDLDNAMIMFKDFRVPKTALLNKYIDIMEDGNIYLKNNSLPSFNIIGQQLFSGRICVAQAAMEFRNRLFHDTKTYAQSKSCWTKDGSQKLITVPHIHDIFKDNEMNYELCNQYVTLCESKLNKYLRSRQLPDTDLINDIAIAKIKCVEDSIKFVHLLQNEIGSYALIEQSGFGQRDFLTCCKFAEGDTRILMQKIVREQLKMYSNNILSKNKTINDLCFDILDKEEDVRLIYELADIIIKDRLANYRSKHSKL
jgi:acyl-CoA oxidase